MADLSNGHQRHLGQLAGMIESGRHGSSKSDSLPALLQVVEGASPSQLHQ